MSQKAFLPGRRPLVRLCVNDATQPFGFFMMQGPKLFTLHWCSFLGCGNKPVISLFHYNAHQYIHFASMWQCHPLIAECVRLNIIDTLLTLTLITSKQPLYTQQLYAMYHIHIIDIQYWVCMWYCLHPGVLLPLNFWSTAIHTIWGRDEVAFTHSHAFGQQFAPCRSLQ